MAQKRSFNEGRRHFKKNKKQKPDTSVSDGSNEDILLRDVRRLLKAVQISEKEEDSESRPTIENGEVELTIDEISSTGDGLAQKDGQIYVVPFTAPGDLVKANVYKHVEEQSYVLTDLISVTTPSRHRTETPRCPYFAQCSGCQFQHLPYAYQLAHKRTVVEKAFANFSGLKPELVPTIGETMASPLQYGYRTKLTPHFDGPKNGRRDRRNHEKVTWEEVPAIGFMKKGTRKTMDIEDCPIGTDAVRRGMKSERMRVARDINQYQRGATLLLRESTKKTTATTQKGDLDSSQQHLSGTEQHDGETFVKTCITNHNATSTEFVNDYRLDNPAGSFFQNNNSILPVVTQYIRDHILQRSVKQADGTASAPSIKHMIDAYCGSGFFTITLSGMFDSSIGIDISSQSITYATRNAELNKLPASSVKFIAGDANALFASVDPSKIPPEETAVVIDPPRKGCDEGFIRQLMDYGPSRICYVSCNVHTQARDIGWLVGGLGDRQGMYEIESLRGFDFFPQTSHVEGVAILQKKSVSEHAGAGPRTIESTAASDDRTDSNTGVATTSIDGSGDGKKPFESSTAV